MLDLRHNKSNGNEFEFDNVANIIAEIFMFFQIYCHLNYNFLPQIFISI